MSDIAHLAHIETGPHKHAIQGTFSLYLWETEGNNGELANADARVYLGLTGYWWSGSEVDR